jgi:hypothetical protein
MLTSNTPAFINSQKYSKSTKKKGSKMKAPVKKPMKKTMPTKKPMKKSKY